MSYQNITMTAALVAPWALSIGTIYWLRAYIPGGLMPFMGFGLAIVGHVLPVWLLLHTNNLGGDSANRQPAPTADGPAHDACQPLAPAPLPQRRPWALPSPRMLTVGTVAVLLGLAGADLYVKTATFIPVSKAGWYALIALVFVTLTACVATVLGFACLVGDCDLEESNGPESDSAR
jgi:hypothetical protein